MNLQKAKGILLVQQKIDRLAFLNSSAYLVEE